MTRFLTIAPILGLFLIALAGFADEATIKRSYIDLDWEQIYLRTAHPHNTSDNVPVACFAPTPYSGCGGVGTIRALVSKFYDANGDIREVNQILRD